MCRLVAADPSYFPLGLAYGHCSGVAPSLLDLDGRGFASQEIIEELASRSDLSARVRGRGWSGGDADSLAPHPHLGRRMMLPSKS